MADLEHASSLLRMAYKDFNALVGMQGNSLFADEIFGFQCNSTRGDTGRVLSFEEGRQFFHAGGRQSP